MRRLQVTMVATGGTGTLTYTLGTLSNDTGVFIVPAGNYAYSVKDENECEVSSTAVLLLLNRLNLQLMLLLQLC